MYNRNSRVFLLALAIAILSVNIEASFNKIISNLKPLINDVTDTSFGKFTSLNDLDSEYKTKHEAIIEEEEQLSNGGQLKLTPKEQKVNQIFMRHKMNELRHALENPDENSAALHFFKAKPLIEKSEVFRFIQKMPKGAILHIHSTAAVSSEWVISNLTYMPGILSCVNTDGVTIYTFRQNLKKHKCVSSYLQVECERMRVKEVCAYDWMLERNINLFTYSPEIEYNTIDKVWSKFQSMFVTMGDVLKYLPVFRAFHWRMLEEMYEDKVMYAEVRIRFKKLYDETGSTSKISAEQSVGELIKTVEAFKALHPGFIGIKTIYATRRDRSKKEISEDIDTFKKLHTLYPDFIVGFDLVGQEDKGKPLHTFVEVLQNLPKTAKFYFHAGETNWYGSSTDLNLVDAILMNTTRIGHGYALLKHPVLRRAVKERGIAIEVSPMSNQILGLVWDLRNHPGGLFMSEDLPMVITNDDPGFFDAKGLSYDLYYAIMSLASNTAGLKTLKNIVWSSIKYSSLNDKEKENAFNSLSRQWDKFVDSILQQEGILEFDCK